MATIAIANEKVAIERYTKGLFVSKDESLSLFSASQALVDIIKASKHKMTWRGYTLQRYDNSLVWMTENEAKNIDQFYKFLDVGLIYDKETGLWSEDKEYNAEQKKKYEFEVVKNV